MKLNEYRQQVGDWIRLIENSGLHQSSGKKVPITFFKTVFGISRTQHRELYNETYSKRDGQVPLYVQRQIALIKQLTVQQQLTYFSQHLFAFEQNKD